ncbi:putative BTB/POZ domain-containing protein NPY2-like isoform X4 [Capsicum annuum]|nr:putative BTB/POZ domain-containing protein NPY2-like isoform X4 [Capsicum annuum]
MHTLTDEHWKAVKRVLRYLKETASSGLRILRSSDSNWYMYVDANWAGDPNDRISTSGYILFFGPNPVSWSSRKQRAVARSSTEAEYKSVANALAEITWVRNLLHELHVTIPKTPTIYCDNVGVTYLSHNPVFHTRMKHVAVDFAYVHDQVHAHQVHVTHTHACDQLADTFTKPLPKSAFIRYVAAELATAMVISVGDVKFYLHKFPLRLKSYRLQKLVARTNKENSDEINIHDIPGGPAAFEVCAKFCYNMTVTLNAYNVFAARCAAEYLEMYESVEKGNLIYTIEVFLTSCIFQIWKDSIIVLQTAKAFLPCNDKNERISSEAIGEALKAYANRRLPGFSKCSIQGSDPEKHQYLVDTIIWLLPKENRSVSCSFLIKLLQISIASECGQTVRSELKSRIGLHMEDATVGDLLIRAPDREAVIFDIDLVHDLVENFILHRKSSQIDYSADNRFQDISPAIASDDSEVKEARIIDGYLAEVARDPNLPQLKFINLAELVSDFSRPSPDGIYRAIDMYLKEHLGITKSERKRICKLMNRRKISAKACMHAVQNERLPLRVVVQVRFFEQVRATASSGGGSTPDLTKSVKALPPMGSQGCFTSATSNAEDNSDDVLTAKELKALKGELSTLKIE